MAQFLPVPRIDLAPGLSISRVLTGLWQLADMERDGRAIDLARTATAMQPYVDAGLTTFDMADHYGSAELVAGIFRSRDTGTVQCLTKWVPKPGRVSKAEVRTAVERALARLQAESLDLLQYHAWNYADPSWLETLYDLQDLKREGLIRQLGLTNVDTAHLRMVRNSGIEVVSNQVSFSLLDQRAAAGLAPYCEVSGVGLLAYGTVAGGWLTEKWLGQPEPDWERTGTWSMMKYGRFLRVAGGWDALQRVLAAAKVVATRHGVSIANIATRYILDQPGVAGVIVGARLGERAHIDDTLRLFSFSLSDEDRADIRTALQTLAPIPGDCGDEYRTPPFLTASGDLSHHLQSMPAPYETRAGADGRTRCLSGTVWETAAGFARAIRHGQHIAVSGTTATLGDRAIGGQDAASQTHFAIDKVEGALQSLGAALTDVVRTRVYVRHVRDWEAVARAHGERFGRIQPANTLVGAELIGDEYLVEVEADAIARPLIDTD
ncbi:MAG: aldo/keto reductase [Acidobacteriota bacterium]|nr:aldo/keto reductase [Acidobacteriota bacterium]